MSFLQKMTTLFRRNPNKGAEDPNVESAGVRRAFTLAELRKREPNKTKRRLARGMVLLPNGRMTSRHDLRCLAIMGMKFTTKKAKAS
jgi:hypothetical protein